MKLFSTTAIALSLLGNMAIAQECLGGPPIETLENMAIGLLDPRHLGDPGDYREKLEEAYSSQGLTAAAEILCAFEGVADTGLQSFARRGLLTLLISPDVQSFDRTHILFDRVNLAYPEDAAYILREEIEVGQLRVYAARTAMTETLAERQAVIDAQRVRIRELDGRIAELQERLAEEQERLAEAQERLADINAGRDAEIIRIRQDIARLRALRSSFEGMIDVIEGRAPVSSLD